MELDATDSKIIQLLQKDGRMSNADLAALQVRVNQHVSRSARLHQMILQMEPFEKTPTQKIKRFLYQS